MSPLTKTQLKSKGNLSHSVHQAITPPQKHHSLIFAKFPFNLQSAQAPFFANTHSIWFFCELPHEKLDFSVSTQNIKVFHP